MSPQLSVVLPSAIEEWGITDDDDILVFGVRLAGDLKPFGTLFLQVARVTSPIRSEGVYLEIDDQCGYGRVSAVVFDPDSMELALRCREFQNSSELDVRIVLSGLVSDRELALLRELETEYYAPQAG